MNDLTHFELLAACREISPERFFTVDARQSHLETEPEPGFVRYGIYMKPGLNLEQNGSYIEALSFRECLEIFKAKLAATPTA